MSLREGCASRCDCRTGGGAPHHPDCSSTLKCNEPGGMCDKHEAEAIAAYRRQRDEDQDLRDAGRGHLVRP